MTLRAGQKQELLFGKAVSKIASVAALLRNDTFTFIQWQSR
jgi:hypothetical protein